MKGRQTELYSSVLPLSGKADPGYSSLTLNETTLSASYTTLSPADRILTCVPRNPWSVEIDRNENEVVVRVESFDGVRTFGATYLNENCCEIRVENYPNIRGRRDRLGSVIEFTSSASFVEQWIEMAQSEVAA